MKSLQHIIVFMGLLAGSFPLKAQMEADSNKVYQLSEIIVIGTRTERSVATLPIPVQIISGENIEKLGVSRLSEIIQEQTGLITVPDFGGGEGIQLQGLDAAYTMILIDGQPLMGRSAGTLDLSRITVNNIDRIEIIKGASSCLYGSEALAGVVNIITKKIKVNNKLKARVNYKIATFNTHDASTSIQYGKNKIGLELFGNCYSSDGYNLSSNDFLQTVEPYHNFTIQPKVKFEFSDKLDVSINSRFYTQNQTYKAQVSNENYTGKSKIREWNHAILVNQTVSEKLKWVFDFYATHYKADEFLNNSLHQLFEETQYNQWFYRPEIRSHYKIGRNTLSTGGGIIYETLNRTLFSEKATLNAEYVFAQYEWFIKEKWNVLLGFRYDNHHQYQSQFSPKIGVNFEWNDAFSFKTSIGYGYKAPDLRQLYLDFTNSSVGYTVLGYNVAEERLNELQNQGQILFSHDFNFSNSLKPESSLNFNVGGFYRKNKHSFDFNFFHNTITDLIDTKAIAQKINGQNVFSYFNIHKIFTYGMEINTSYNILENLSISAGYQYLIAKDQSILNQLENGEIFARNPLTLSSFKLKSSDYFGLYNRSKHTANVKINYQIPALKTTFNLRVLYRSKYGSFDSNHNAILDQYDDFVKGYCLTHISITKEWKAKFSLQIGVINLFDYTDPNYISNLPGRQISTRIQYQF